jgi:hypothetical protein
MHLIGIALWRRDAIEVTLVIHDLVRDRGSRRSVRLCGICGHPTAMFTILSPEEIPG